MIHIVRLAYETHINTPHTISAGNILCQIISMPMSSYISRVRFSHWELQKNKNNLSHLKWLHINYKLDKAVCAKHIATIVCALWVHEQVNCVKLTWKAWLYMNWVHGSWLSRVTLHLCSVSVCCTVDMSQCVKHMWSIPQVRQVLLYNGTKMKMVEVLCSSNISNSFIG